MNKRACFVALVALVPALTVPLAALAGVKSDAPVFINLAQRSASGALGSARNAQDTRSQVRCWLEGFDPSVGIIKNTSLTCFFQNSVGQQAMCHSNEPSVAAAVHALGTDSALFVQWDPQGRCTMVQVSNDSAWAPKGP